MATSPRSADLPRRHIVLIGMMGAGKTTVGSRLARALDRPFVDSDVQVEQRTARTVREIFETDGEAAYRALEAEVLAEALGSEEPAVIAAAGGTILDPSNRRRMRDFGTVVFLEADPKDLVSRVGGQDHRPLLKDDPAGVLRQMDHDRRALYEETAHVIVDASANGPDHVVEEIIEVLSA
jgi:shikimate kinase